MQPVEYGVSTKLIIKMVTTAITTRAARVIAVTPSSVIADTHDGARINLAWHVFETPLYAEWTNWGDTAMPPGIKETDNMDVRLIDSIALCGIPAGALNWGAVRQFRLAQ